MSDPTPPAGPGGDVIRVYDRPPNGWPQRRAVSADGGPSDPDAVTKWPTPPEFLDDYPPPPDLTAAELYARLPLPGGEDGMLLYRQRDEGRWLLASADGSGSPIGPEEISPACAFHWMAQHGVNPPPEMQIHVEA